MCPECRKLIFKRNFEWMGWGNNFIYYLARYCYPAFSTMFLWSKLSSEMFSARTRNRAFSFGGSKIGFSTLEIDIDRCICQHIGFPIISEEAFRPCTLLSNLYLDFGGYLGEQQQCGAKNKRGIRILLWSWLGSQHSGHGLYELLKRLIRNKTKSWFYQ